MRKKKVDYEQELYDFSDNEMDSVSNRINLNSATASNLQKLPGIGVKTAQKIIDYRNKQKKFQTISELMNVKGIGKVKFEKIKKYIFVE